MTTINLPRYTKLPLPVEPHWNWQLHGLCRGLDSALFFHPEGERGHARANRERRAKALCQECPVMRECLTHALQTDEPYGIWGGLGESERDAVLRPSPRNRHRRPRLDPELFPQFQEDVILAKKRKS